MFAIINVPPFVFFRYLIVMRFTLCGFAADSSEASCCPSPVHRVRGCVPPVCPVAGEVHFGLLCAGVSARVLTMSSGVAAVLDGWRDTGSIYVSPSSGKFSSLAGFYISVSPFF